MTDMVWVQRDINGAVIAVYANQQPGIADQQIPADDAVVAQLTTISRPLTVTPRQARLALNQQGLLSQVNAAVAAAGGPTQITWEYASQITRTDPLIAAIGAQLGLNDAQIDALFALAQTF